MQNYLELFDKRLGDQFSGPITVNFRHEFDRPVQRVTLKNGTILVGSAEQIPADDYSEAGYVVDVGTEDESNPIAVFDSEIRKVDEFVPGNHQITGVTTCTVICPKTGQVFTGEALCGREDRYNRRLGRALSFVRAWFAMTTTLHAGVELTHQGLSAFIARNYRVYMNPADDISAQETLTKGLPAAYPEFKYVNSAVEDLLVEYNSKQTPSIRPDSPKFDEDIIMNLILGALDASAKSNLKVIRL